MSSAADPDPSPDASDNEADGPAGPPDDEDAPDEDAPPPPPLRVALGALRARLALPSEDDPEDDPDDSEDDSPDD